MTTYARKPVTISSAACMPVVRQLAAIAHAAVQNANRRRGHRDEYSRAARQAHTT